jgi:tetratricopeptide (TPR) repeat protein
MRASLNAVLAALTLAAAVPSLAGASECTMAQLYPDAAAVIAPCSLRLEQSNLTAEQRAQARFVRGRGYHRTRRLDQAAADYQAAFTLRPIDEEILVSWSNVDLRQGRMRDYRARVEQAYRMNPENPVVLRTVGTLYSNMGDRRRAIEFYTKALSINPSEAFALYFRARLYRLQRMFTESIADASALLAIPRETLDQEGFLDEDGDVRSFHVAALLQRAFAFEDAGQTDLAAQDYDAAVAAENSAPALIARGWFLSTLPDRNADQLRDFTAAVTREPNNAAAQYALGGTLLATNRFEDAFQAFDAAVTARPQFGKALRMRARMHRHFGRTDLALRDLHHAIAYDPHELDAMMKALRHAGYWKLPRPPDQMTPEFADAMRACMIDVACN